MALPVPPDPRELVLRGMVARSAYERWLQRELIAVLEGAFREIVHTLVVDYADLTLRERQRLQALFVQVDRQLRAAYGEMGSLAQRQLEAYGRVEAEAAVHQLRALAGIARTAEGGVGLTTSLLSTGAVRAIASLPIEGLTLGEWWQAQAANMSAATRRAIQTGLVLGESTRDITRRILPPRDVTDPAVWRRARAEASTIVRTSMTAVHNTAALESYEQLGGDVTGEYELVAVRDSRTSTICAALDGRRFRYDDPKRLMPPFHPNCRTTAVPVINYRALGLRPPGKQSALSFRSLDEWLSEQPHTTAVEILGRTRAEWYRDGRMALRDLIDQDRRVLTLEELRRKLGIPDGP